MTTLGDSLDAYLAIRRGLGTELVRPGAHLQRFVEFSVQVPTLHPIVALPTRPASGSAVISTVAHACIDGE